MEFNFGNILMIILFQLNCFFHVGMSQHHISLPQLQVKKHPITLSGFSSGAGMAQQMQISYSSIFSGVAVFSQTFYRCGPGDGILTRFDRVCTTLGNATREEFYDPNRSVAEIRMYGEHNLIDNPDHLKYIKLYVYAGLNHNFFLADMILDVVTVFEQFIPNPTQIMTRVQNAGFTLPTDSYGGRCSLNGERTFYVGNCGLNGPLEALQFLLGPEIKSSRNRRLNMQPLLTFDQTEFFGNEIHYMNDIGFIYIPTACRSNYGGNCYLHFYFHGCGSGVDFVGTNHILNSGYMEIAEANNIVIVFPQNLRSDEPELGDLGCWDTYGFTGRYFATKRGVQIRIVKRMLDRIMGQEGAFSMQQNHYQNYQNFLNDTSTGFHFIPSFNYHSMH